MNDIVLPGQYTLQEHKIKSEKDKENDAAEKKRAVTLRFIH
jgi:hypothetical protein